MTRNETTVSDTSEQRIVVGIDGSPWVAIGVLRCLVALDAIPMELDP